MTLRRLLAMGVAAACAALPVIAVAPAAHAEDGSRIASVDLVRLFRSDLHLVAFRLQAFDQGGGSIPYSGTVHFANTYFTSVGASYSMATESLDAQVASADGAPDVFTIDIRGLHTPSTGVVPRLSLTAPGDAVAYAPSGPDAARERTVFISAPDATAQEIPGVLPSDSVVSASDVRSAQAVSGSWPCDEIDLTFAKANCVVSTPTTGTETWQRGAKLEFHWTPLRDPSGNLYRRCLLSPDLSIRTDWKDGVSRRTEQSPDIDVPGDWSTYTLPLDSVDQLVAVDFGKTTITWFLSCYNLSSDQLFGHEGHAEQVPDLPPSQPTTATITPSASGATVEAAGSEQQGAAPMLGYTAQVVDSSGAVVATAKIPVVRAMRAGTMRATGSVPRRVTASFAHLRPGRYHVVVSAYNRIGASFVRTSRTVAVAKPLGAPRRLTVHRAGAGITASWKAPSRKGAGIARYRVTVKHGTHVLRAVSLSASRSSWHLAKVAAHTSYLVTVEVVARNGVAQAARVTFRR